MRLSDFHYDLPEELIASHPLPERSQSRLLQLDKKSGEIKHHVFSDLASILQPNDLLVCNNTRVIPARLFGKKASGGQIEMLVERILDDHCLLAYIRASKTPKPKSVLVFKDIIFEVIGRRDELYECICHDPRPLHMVIETLGEIPIPPYFKRSVVENDKERYQTIYAKQKGSVAAPTAGLHFDDALFQALPCDIGYLTLHVGAGTFSPVRVDNIVNHRMHAEVIDVPASLCEQIKQTKENGGRIVAVGTTAARSLETANRSGTIQAFKGETDIFIYPGFTFQCVDALITNFHLPSSTLLMLVSAFAGIDAVKEAYQTAILERYRFFSYGDAMLIL